MFYIKGSGNVPIYLHFRRVKGNKKINLKYYVGETIESDWWLKSSHRMRKLDGVPHERINRKLDKLEVALRNILLDYDFDDLTEEIIKDELSYRTTGKRINKDDFISYSKLPILSDFKDTLTFSDVDYRLLDDLASWMRKTVSARTGRIYNGNYISQTIQKVRSAYNRAVREGRAKPVDLTYRCERKQVVSVYLSESELEKIYRAKLSPSQSVVRDWFLIGCFTGLRVGNYLNLKKANINREKNYMEVVVNKNGPRVKIPLHRIVVSILDRWGNEYPKPPGVDVFNRQVKVVCRNAGITDMVLVPLNEGGVSVERFRPKYEVISSHTARRSMATNLYLRDVPLRYIMAITGHKTESMCLHYIKAGISELYDKVAELDFWK